MLERAEEIRNKRKEIVQQIEKLEKHRKESTSNREVYNSYSDTLQAYPSLIDAFNACHTVQDILKATYAQKGNTFRHPKSESGFFLQM